MSFSNKSLLIALIVCLVISLLGTFLTISSLSSLRPGKYIPSTGYAASARGNVTMRITQELSITTLDSQLINFNGCVPGRTIYSNTSNGNSFGDCEGFNATAIIVRNTGNFPANITMNASAWGEAHNGTFLNSLSDDSWIAYKVTNDSVHPLFGGGCINSFPDDWVNITDGSQLLVCDELASGVVNNSVSFDLAIYLPESMANGENEISFTFWASQVW